ncbi:hypothetical protein LAC81_19710 [Ensifer adhaerens]|uniref:PepSY domain-containing protein n=1 Tax=Ensifer adhaerens TaxID=106592 RepID=UPI001CBC1736|nr:hypothetical protein [Ensifer adhaerens]MBZ7924016.1 hypothetical protein [Ensifer adhaerens]UAX92547.1 hypothetical protein LAC78_19700 [Ensifer adhaerens]UAY00183.1 hypothetical protein LAC80_19710 [Ensifer adhaerens]UAY07565.1 hypothetical protein LAC81_19710 [Ensifer adhaerens]
MAMTRRDLIALFCCSLLLSLAPQHGRFAALAKDGGGGGSHGGGGDNSGSGHGGGDDDHDDDRGKDGGGDDGDDDDDDDDDAGGGGSGRRSDQERARDAVERGDILPLKDVLRLVDEDKYGTVIAVDLRHSGSSEVYRLRTRDRQGTIRNLRINARTGKFMNIFGF